MLWYIFLKIFQRFRIIKKNVVMSIWNCSYDRNKIIVNLDLEIFYVYNSTLFTIIIKEALEFWFIRFVIIMIIITAFRDCVIHDYNAMRLPLFFESR